MNLEGQNQMCSNSTRSSKKQKQKKIPQRGLGVAQLERIRIEEQQKRIAANAIFTYPPIVSPTTSSSLPVSLLNYPSSQSPPSVAFPSSSPTSITNIENLYLNSVPAPPGGGFDVGWPSVTMVDGSGHLHKMWHHYELNHDLPLHPNASLPLSDTVPSPPQFSQASASSLMNIPLMNSPVISNFQMEPPSNQSSHSNFSSFWPEVDKMASAKRPYPFPLEMPAPPSFQCKLPRTASSSDESTSFGNGSLLNGDHAVPIFRGIPLMPSSSTTEHTRKKNNKGNGNQHGDFLTLAPPSVTSPHPIPRLRHSLSHRPAQEAVAESPRSAGFFSFFPASQQASSAANNHSNSDGNGEVGNTIDLNLKL